MTMPRPITAILRDIDTVEKSKHLNETQKNHAISMFKRELNEAVGQPDLPLVDDRPVLTSPKAK